MAPEQSFAGVGMAHKYEAADFAPPVHHYLRNILVVLAALAVIVGLSVYLLLML